MKKLIILGTVSLFLASSLAMAAGYYPQQRQAAPNRAWSNANNVSNPRNPAFQHNRAWHKHQARHLHGKQYHLGQQHHHPSYQHNYNQ